MKQLTMVLKQLANCQGSELLGPLVGQQQPVGSEVHEDVGAGWPAYLGTTRSHFGTNHRGVEGCVVGVGALFEHV